MSLLYNRYTGLGKPVGDCRRSKLAAFFASPWRRRDDAASSDGVVEERTGRPALRFQAAVVAAGDTVAEAKADVAAIEARLAALGAEELLDALRDLERAYREFPELELHRPPARLLEGARGAVRHFTLADMTVFLDHFTGGAPSSSEAACRARLAGFIRRSEAFCGELLAVMRERMQERLPPVTLAGLLELLDARVDDIPARADAVLTPLLLGRDIAGEEGRGLAATALSARRRLAEPAARHREAELPEKLLAMVQRLRIAAPERRAEPDRAWPSARLSFDEFLLQWPCEVHLSVEGDDEAFIAAAYQAILLRPADAAEVQQYLSLLRNGDISRRWVIDDLMCSQELALLERPVRVVYGSEVITAPGRADDAAKPAVIWPPEQPLDQGNRRA